MKIKFTNLYKLIEDKSKILKKINILIKNSKFVGGYEVVNFEKKFKTFVKSKYCVTLGNGTDALEIAVASLNLKKGSEIITPNLTFSTTVAPMYQLGLIPHFIGVEENKFIADPKHIEKCINKTIHFTPIGTTD